MAAISGLLKTIPLLAGLNEGQLASVAGICERSTLAPGEVLVEAGRQADSTFLIIDGCVDCLSAESGQQKSTATIPNGAILLELAMLVEIEVGATCIAAAKSKVLRIPRQKMHDLMQEDIGMTDAIVEHLTLRLSEMADVMREANQHFEEVIRNSA